MICLIKHSLTQVIWRCIIIYIVGIIHVCVRFVIRHSFTIVFQSDISYHIIRIQYPLIFGSHSLWCIVFRIITVCKCGFSLSLGNSKKFLWCLPWCNFMLGQLHSYQVIKEHLVGFWVFMYFRCLQMMDCWCANCVFVNTHKICHLSPPCPIPSPKHFIKQRRILFTVLGVYVVSCNTDSLFFKQVVVCGEFRKGQNLN